MYIKSNKIHVCVLQLFRRSHRDVFAMGTNSRDKRIREITETNGRSSQNGDSDRSVVLTPARQINSRQLTQLSVSIKCWMELSGRVTN